MIHRSIHGLLEGCVVSSMLLIHSPLAIPIILFTSHVVQNPQNHRLLVCVIHPLLLCCLSVIYHLLHERVELIRVYQG